MPQDPQSDQDFLKASPGEQHAYLLATDPEYAKAAPADQKAYIQHISPTHGAGTPEEFAAEKTASGSIAPPLTSPWEATKYGMKEFGGGLADIGKGIYNTLKPPETTGEKIAGAAFPPSVPLYRMGKGVVDLGRQAMQVPGAIKDLYNSPDPVGTLALTAPRVGGQTAGTLIAGKAPEIAESAMKVPAGQIMRTAGKTIANQSIKEPFKAVSKIPDYWRQSSPEGQMLAETKRAVAERRASMIPMRVPAAESPRMASPPPVSYAGTRIPEAPAQVAPPPLSWTKAAPEPAVRPVAPPPVKYGPRPVAEPMPRPVPPPPVRYSVKPTPEVPGRMTPPPPIRWNKPAGEEGGAGAAPVTFVPEPRPEFEGEQPNYMASVPRNKLGKMAMSRKPGAGVQLQQLGQPIVYIPNEADYPGPRK